VPEVTDNHDRLRYETEIDGTTAYLSYARQGDHLVLVHTEVPGALEGHGVGGALVSAAIDDAARRGLVVVPRCPFASAWLRRHPDAAERVTIEWPDG
jgi:predicted GNAT family acetyltransferase